MFWEDLVRRWRREHHVVDPRDLRAAGGHVAVLPAPRRRRRSRLPWLVVTVLAIIGALALLLISGGPAEAAGAVIS
jgi:hypothetical protein